MLITAACETVLVDSIVVSTVVYAEADEVYAFLRDFPGYANYSKYLTAVDQYGDGGVGTEYALRFAWWKLTYTARSKVVAVDPPSTIDWQIIKDIDASGAWHVDPRDELPADAPEDATAACEVALEVNFDPDSADASVLNLPSLVSFGWVLERAIPLISDEAERVIERAVRDLEGRTRDVSISVTADSSYL
ncbi:MAG: polyketide cyclase / dehydrase and lipid transport [Halonotius sp. J07HN6]|nr:MAG: polyketide cyclase / dehydrase and lipid transport [Halonotius sp. J07HN6]